MSAIDTIDFIPISIQDRFLGIMPLCSLLYKILDKPPCGYIIRLKSIIPEDHYKNISPVIVTDALKAVITL
jgi:hypothetical protein